jgi:hypothetical protein
VFLAQPDVPCTSILKDLFYNYKAVIKQHHHLPNSGLAGTSFGELAEYLKLI